MNQKKSGINCDTAASGIAAANNTVIQGNLTIGSVNDPLEHEADSVADKVMCMPENSLIQRKCDGCKDEEEKVQRKPLASYIQKMGNYTGLTASDSVSQKINSTKGRGSNLDSSTKSFMENRFDTDFSEVKIHTGDYAVQMSQELNAQAFTVGNDVYFNSGKYNPDSNSGKHLLAHELTHTVQQGEKASIQRSCSDGNCDTCAGGRKTINVTVFFRRRATAQTMQVLRTKINEAKSILNNCCINLLFGFDWRLLSGNRTFDVGASRPAGSADGAWDYTDDAETLGEGNTFTGARGIPMLVVDDTPTASGLTVSNAFDNQYTGVPYMVLPIDTGKTRSIAHELGHVGGILPHSAAASIMDRGLSTNVTDEYCTAVRSIAH